MAQYYTLFITDDGVGATGLTPTITTLLNVSDASSYTPVPTIAEVGGGFYRFELPLTLSDFDHIVGIVDAGSSIAENAERYIPIDIRYNDFDFDSKSVHISPVYDEDTDTLTFMMFGLISGKVIEDNITSFSIVVYDENHTQLFSLGTASQTNGVAIMSQSSPGIIANRTYYAVATLVTSKETIKSVDTYFSIQ